MDSGEMMVDEKVREWMRKCQLVNCHLEDLYQKKKVIGNYQLTENELDVAVIGKLSPREFQSYVEERTNEDNRGGITAWRLTFINFGKPCDETGPTTRKRIQAVPSFPLVEAPKLPKQLSNSLDGPLVHLRAKPNKNGEFHPESERLILPVGATHDWRKWTKEDVQNWAEQFFMKPADRRWMQATPLTGRELERCIREDEYRVEKKMDYELCCLVERFLHRVINHYNMG